MELNIFLIHDYFIKKQIFEIDNLHSTWKRRTLIIFSIKKKPIRFEIFKVCHIEQVVAISQDGRYCDFFRTCDPWNRESHEYVRAPAIFFHYHLENFVFQDVGEIGRVFRNAKKQRKLSTRHSESFLRIAQRMLRRMGVRGFGNFDRYVLNFQWCQYGVWRFYMIRMCFVSYVVLWTKANFQVQHLHW